MSITTSGEYGLRKFRLICITVSESKFQMLNYSGLRKARLPAIPVVFRGLIIMKPSLLNLNPLIVFRSA